MFDDVTDFSLYGSVEIERLRDIIFPFEVAERSKKVNLKISLEAKPLGAFYTDLEPSMRPPSSTLFVNYIFSKNVPIIR